MLFEAQNPRRLVHALLVFVHLAEVLEEQFFIPPLTILEYINLDWLRVIRHFFNAVEFPNFTSVYILIHDILLSREKTNGLRNQRRVTGNTTATQDFYFAQTSRRLVHALLGSNPATPDC